MAVSGPGASAEPGLHGFAAGEAEPELPQAEGADPGETACLARRRGTHQPGTDGFCLPKNIKEILEVGQPSPAGRGLYIGKYSPPGGGGNISRCHLGVKI